MTVDLAAERAEFEAAYSAYYAHTDFSWDPDLEYYTNLATRKAFYGWQIGKASVIEQFTQVLPGGNQYLDPPDGGDVPITEQLRRMAVDAARWREVSARFDNAKTSTSEQILFDLRLIEFGVAWLPLAEIVDNAIAAQKAKS